MRLFRRTRTAPMDHTAEGLYPWRWVTTEHWATEQREVAAVVGHYLEHPEDRPELGTDASLERALSLS
ncbi:hypothetical protein LG293_09190 [Citricoccus nitrophenolicus]